MTTLLTSEPVSPPLPLAKDDDALYEIIDGQRVELPPMSAYSAVLASWLVARLDVFADGDNLGRAVCEVLFHLPLNGDRNRRPDGAFVSFQRWPRNRRIPPQHAWDVVPNLAIEVVSPTEFAEELLLKIDEYFRAGVQLVWVVYPQQALVYVYESMTRIRGLTRTDELDGGSVIPGFRLPLATLFQEETPTSESRP
jgi:Uma2 family endonuclease